MPSIGGIPVGVQIMNTKEDAMYELEQRDGLVSPFPPTLTFRASDEYNTRIEIHLPSEQKLVLMVSPDYTDEPRVYWTLTPVPDVGPQELRQMFYDLTDEQREVLMKKLEEDTTNEAD